jgi:hypothetical protein
MVPACDSSPNLIDERMWKLGVLATPSKHVSYANRRVDYRSGEHIDRGLYEKIAGK